MLLKGKKKKLQSRRLRSFSWRGSRLLPNASGSGLISAETFLGRVGRKCCSHHRKQNPQTPKPPRKKTPNILKPPKSVPQPPDCLFGASRCGVNEYWGGRGVKTAHGGGENPPWEQRSESLKRLLSIIWSLLGFLGCGEEESERVWQGKCHFSHCPGVGLTSLQSLLDLASSPRAQHPATPPGAKGPACEEYPAGKYIKKEGEN